jgi:hypothetical protein
MCVFPHVYVLLLLFSIWMLNPKFGKYYVLYILRKNIVKGFEWKRKYWCALYFDGWILIKWINTRSTKLFQPKDLCVSVFQMCVYPHVYVLFLLFSIWILNSQSLIEWRFFRIHYRWCYEYFYVPSKVEHEIHPCLILYVWWTINPEFFPRATMSFIAWNALSTLSLSLI